MPLTCLRAGETLAAFRLTEDEWAAIRANYRSMTLSMRCCSGDVVPKVSSLGTRFFAHKSRAHCQTAPESPEHLKAKLVIVESARTVGWKALAEASGTDPDGSPWVADVLCIRGEVKVAFEVQLASQSPEEYLARQKRYQRSGIRCLWLSRLRVNGSAIESFPPSKDLPHVLLDVKEPANMTVYVGNSSGGPIPLEDFVRGALEKDLFWAETRPGRQAVELQVASMTCYRCRKIIKAIRGYVINNHLVPLAEVSDTDTLTAFVSTLRQRAPEVTPVGHRHSRTVQGKYFAATCPFCSALLGDWFMTADFFTEVTSCSYPDCRCQDAALYGWEIGCRVFAYQSVSLTLRPSELSELPAGQWLWRPFTRGANPIGMTRNPTLAK